MTPDMLFVSHTQRTARPYSDPSARYRSFALADHFRRKGHRTAFLSQQVFEREIDSLASVPLIQFHRPAATEALLRFVCKPRLNQKIIADYDDLIFDVAATREMPVVKDQNWDVTQIGRTLAANAEIGEMFQYRSASTGPLAEAATRLLGRATVTVHNALDPLYLGVAQILSRKAATRPKPFSLGYFSGSNCHNADLHMVLRPLVQFLAEDEERTLLLLGQLTLPRELERFGKRVVLREAVSFNLMPAEIVKCRMVIGPQVDTFFARCKSGQKFFEAAVLGVPVAATPIPDIDRFDSPLLHKCRTPEDWAAAFRAPAPSGTALAEAIADVVEIVTLEREAAVWAEAFLE